MKIINKTKMDTGWLRNMARWVAKEVGVSQRAILVIEFKHTRNYYWRGWCHTYINGQCSLEVMVHPKGHCSYNHTGRDGFTVDVAGPFDALVMCTAHEMQHAAQNEDGKLARRSKRRSSNDLERNAQQIANKILNTFRAQPELVAQWVPDAGMCVEAVITPQEDKPTLQERRAAKVRKLVEKWERNVTDREKQLKRDRATLSKHRTKERYYKRVLANKNKGTNR